MSDANGKAERFWALHQQSTPFLLPNAWDPGSARMLEAGGAQAIGTTSAGQAFSLARTDGAASSEQVLEGAADIAAAVSVPVTVDLLNGLAETPEGVGTTIRLALEAGLAGGSIEDTTGRAEAPLFPQKEAVSRIAAARKAIDASGQAFVLTARADALFAALVLPNFRPDFEDVVVRLKAFAEAGADVVYAPGITRPEDIKRIADAVSVPMNVLVGLPGMPRSAREYADLGVKRLSLGSSLFAVAYGAAQSHFRDWLRTGVYAPSETTFDYRQASTVMAAPKP